MMETDPGGPHRARDTRHILTLGLAIPLALYLAITFGYGSPYSQQLYNKQAFLGQYTHGIYRFRVLGRELLLAVNHVVHALGINLHTRAVDLAQRGAAWDLFTAFTLLNGVAFVAFAILVYSCTVRDSRWTVPYLILVAVTAVSGYVVTPYDFLSYLLIAAALVVAFAARRWSWPVCLVLSALGTATRESFYVAVAAVVAVAVTRPGSERGIAGQLGGLVPRRDDPFLASAWSMAVGSLATYVGPRIVISSAGGQELVQNVRGAANVNMSSAIAALIAGLCVAALIYELPRFDPGAGPRSQWYRRAAIGLWVLSIPYLVVSTIGGNWFEALRLLLPVALCQYLVRWGVNSVQEVSPSHDARKAAGETRAALIDGSLPGSGGV